MKKNKAFLKWIAEKPLGLARLTSTTNDFEYSDYVEHCEGNGRTPQGEDSDDFHRWCADMARMYYEDDVLQLKNLPVLQRPIVVTGTVGRWNGRFDIAPRLFSSFEEAFDEAVTGATDVDVDYCTQHVSVNGHHHDATNHFQLWLVKPHADTEALQRRIDDGQFDPYCLYDRRFLEAITDYLW